MSTRYNDSVVEVKLHYIEDTKEKAGREHTGVGFY
jgi:hypothetical protein